MTNNFNKDLRENAARQPSKPSPEVFGTLLKAAAGKLGTDPETLKRRLESGELEKSIMNSSPENEGMQKLKAALSDPETAKKLLRDPRAAAILKKAGR